MIQVTRRDAKLWSRLGARATYGQAILEMPNNVTTSM